jgi:hypothetical protein
LYSAVVAERDRTLLEELAAELGRLPLGQRAVIRLKTKGILPTPGLPRLVWRELVELTMFQITSEHAGIVARAKVLIAGKTGRPANSFCHTSSSGPRSSKRSRRPRPQHGWATRSHP